MIDVVQVTVGAGIKEEKITIRNGELTVATTPDGIRSPTGRLGRGFHLQLVRSKDFHDFVYCGVRIARLGIQFGIGYPCGWGAPMHMEVGHVGKRKPGEVGIRVFQHVGPFFKMSGAKMSRSIMLGGIGPSQIIKPSPSSDVAKNGSAVYVTGLGSSVDVVDQLMVIGGKICGNVSMPLREVAATVHKVLVVLPDPDDGGGVANNGRSFAEANLVEPFMWGIVTAGFVKPVPIEDSEIHLISHLGVQGIEYRQGGSNAVTATLGIITAGEFKTEIEQSLGITLGILEILCPRHSAKRST